MSYYTYVHSAPGGKIFYVGKGVKDRAYSFGDRSANWKRAVKHYGGVQIQVLAEWSTEEEAFEHEKFLIACFKGMNLALVNATNGGKGAFGVKQSEESKRKKSEKSKGYVHKIVTCPNCKKVGGETSMKRWHFDKCTGLKPFRARAHISGKRINLGRFATQEEADQKTIAFYMAENKPLPKEFIRHKGLT